MSEPKEAAKNPLSRWSERKLAARRSETIDDPAQARSRETPPVEVEPATAAPAEQSETPPLPSIDELDYQSDYTAFLNKNVPEALRRAALRKLWASDPVLANLDGLNDYDEDFNAIGEAISLVRSSYQAGRGYVDEAEKKLAQINETVDGGALDSPAASAQSGLGSDDDALRENDAAADQSADAPRQSVSGAAEDATPEPVKESGKQI